MSNTLTKKKDSRHAIAGMGKKENKFMWIMDTEQKEWHGQFKGTQQQNHCGTRLIEQTL
jgi:hypothetical protein